MFANKQSKKETLACTVYVVCSTVMQFDHEWIVFMRQAFWDAELQIPLPTVCASVDSADIILDC